MTDKSNTQAALLGHGLTNEQADLLLVSSLKPEEIGGAPDLQHRRVRELLHWFARLTQGNANPKWLRGHAFELAYYVATMGPDRSLDVDAIHKAGFLEGVNISPEDRRMLERVGSIAAQPTPEPRFDGIAARKLADLKARGYVVNGYSIQHAETNQRGFITSGGFVGWWINMDHVQPTPEPVAQADGDWGDDEENDLLHVIGMLDKIVSGETVTSSDRLFDRSVKPRKMTIKDAQAIAGPCASILRKLHRSTAAPSPVALQGRDDEGKAPGEIWLQINPDGNADDTGYPSDHEGVTWCWHSIGGQEVRYVRADLARASLPADQPIGRVIYDSNFGCKAGQLYEDLPEGTDLFAASLPAGGVVPETAALDSKDAEIAKLKTAIAKAYGYLWCVNCEPGTPRQYTPERAAYAARKELRDLLTKEQRGAAINATLQSSETQGCTRSHPHELMSPACELRTEIARLTNENERLTRGPETQGRRQMTPKHQGVIADDGKPCPNEHDPYCGWPNCTCRRIPASPQDGGE